MGHPNKLDKMGGSANNHQHAQQQNIDLLSALSRKRAESADVRKMENSDHRTWRHNDTEFPTATPPSDTLASIYGTPF